MKRGLTIVLLFLYSSFSLGSPFYVNLGIGAFTSNSMSSYTRDSTASLYSPTAIGTSLFILPNVNWKNSFNNGLNINLATGYQFNQNWRGEIEFLYQNLNRDISGDYDWQEINSVTQAVYAQSFDNPISHSSSNVNLYSFLTNGYYDFKNNTKWTPFIGAGVGIAWINSESNHSLNILNVDDPSTPLVESAPVSQYSPSLSGTAFAGQFKAGINYEWDENKSLALIYRLFFTSQFKSSSSRITSNPGTTGETSFYITQHNIDGIVTNALELNLRFNV